jgi:hypothetical protein
MKIYLVCPRCIEDNRLAALDYSQMCMWYFCRVCEFKLCDETIYRQMNASKF